MCLWDLLLLFGCPFNSVMLNCRLSVPLPIGAFSNSIITLYIPPSDSLKFKSTSIMLNLQRLISGSMQVCSCSTLNFSLFSQSWFEKVPKLEQRYTCVWFLKTLNNLITLVIPQNPPLLNVTLVSIETLSFAVLAISSIEEHSSYSSGQEMKTGCPKHK